MADVQPPPTYAEVVITDERTGNARFNPIWLKWFLDLVQTLNAGGGTVLAHNSLTGLQGGTTNEYYHLTAVQDAAVAALGTIASQAANNVAITGGTIAGVALTGSTLDSSAVGATTPAAGHFTTLDVKTKFSPPTDAGAVQTGAVYQGAGVPNNANGTNGDIYFNTTGGAGTTVYHKRAGAWAAIL